MPCYSPLKGWRNNETGGIVFKAQSQDSQAMEVACGSCLGCRLDRSRMWANRITHESAMHSDSGGSCFITLTYRDREVCTAEERRNGYHIPDSWSLSTPGTHEDGRQKSSHFQAFMKRLRKHIREEDERIAEAAGIDPIYRKIKYFMCGEYGKICRHKIDLEESQCPQCKLGRPHHHAILLGYRFEDLYKTRVQNGKERYSSPTLEKLWKYGLTDVGDVTVQSAGYVARYNLKKIYGDNAKEHYIGISDDGQIHTLEPEYCSMSNGIGESWLKKFETDVFPDDEVPVLGEGKVAKSAPRYYMEKLANKDPVTYCKIKAKRQIHLKENEEEYTPERLMAKYKVKKARIRMLERTI